VATIDPLSIPWDGWQPAEVNRVLAEVREPWYVAAGWAIDLFLGEQTREHTDLEIAAPSDRFDAVANALERAGFELYVVSEHEAVPLAQAGEALELHHQTWVLERAAGCWRMDVFREPSDGDTWICRRDESIRLPYAELIQRTPGGIPYARPEVVLLFKAKHAHEEKNAADLAAVLPRLDQRAREWLAEALLIAHPGHAWLVEVS
jgi:Aminoglycoside-2''-adenylyltransferase